MKDAIHSALVLPHDPYWSEADGLVAADGSFVGSGRIDHQAVMLSLAQQETDQQR